MKKTKKQFIVILIIFIGALLRMGHLVAPHMDSDQAIFGLQAMHILKGEFPVFSWGYAYIGTLQSYIDAVFFFFFGPSRHLLNFVVLFFYIGYALSLYSLSGAFFKKFHWRVLTLTLGAIAPDFFIIHGIWGRHGYPETYFFGTLMLAMMCNNLEKKEELKFFFMLLLIAGLAWWSNFLILYYFFPLALFLLYHMYLSATWKSRAKIVLSSTGGFLTGSLPFWAYNILNNFASLGIFRNTSKASSFWESFSAFITYSFPVLIGARQHGAPGKILPLWGTVLTAVCAMAFIFFLLHSGLLFFKSIIQKKVVPESILFVFSMTVLGIYFKSSYSINPGNTRYMIPVYSVYPVVLILFIHALAKKRLLKQISFGVLLFVIGLNAVSIWEGSPFFQEKKRSRYLREIEEENNLFQMTRKAGKDRFLMLEYWKAARYTFDAKEEIIFAHVNSRYPRYITDMLMQDTLNYLVNWQDTSLGKGFKILGFDCRKERWENQMLYTDFKIEHPEPLTAIDSSKYTVVASSVTSGIQDISDKSMSTASFVRIPEGSSFSYQIIFKKPVRLGGITFFLKSKYSAPTSLRVKDLVLDEVLVDSRGSFPGYRAGHHPFIPYSPPFFELYFEPKLSDRFEITFLDAKPQKAFWITEMVLMEYLDDQKTNEVDTFAEILKNKDTFDEIYCSMGAVKLLEKSLEEKINYQLQKKINFQKRNLFVFEREYLAFNAKKLEELDVDFISGEGDIFAYIITKSTSLKRAMWLGKVIMNYFDPKYIYSLYKKAKTSYQRKEKKAVQYLESILSMQPEHYSAHNMLIELYKESGDWKRAEEIKNSLERRYKSEKQVSVIFDSKIELKGLTLSKDEVSAGESFEMNYYFFFNKNVKNNFYIFVYFISPDGKILFQDDHTLDKKVHGGSFKIKRKKYYEGELILDRNVVTVPEDVSYKGPLSVWCGIWNPHKQRRFESQTDLEDKSNRVKIGEIIIE